MREDYQSFGPPWGWQPSLEAMVEDVGIDFDEFIQSLKNNESDEEMASRFGQSVATICRLRDHFERFGIDSVIGQD